MTRVDDLRIVKDFVADARRHNWMHLGISGALWVYFLVYITFMPLDTTWAKVRVAFFLLTSINEFFLIRGLVRMRAKAPVIAALFERPEEIDSITGWPSGVKQPSGKYPGYLRFRTRDMAHATLRVTPERTQQVVAALHARSPNAHIAVDNVVLPPPAPSTAPGA